MSEPITTAAPATKPPATTPVATKLPPREVVTSGLPVSVPRKPGQSLFDRARWDELESRSSSGRDLVRTLHFRAWLQRQILEAKKVLFDVAFYDDVDIVKMVAEGWEVLTPEHWNEFTQFNKVVAGRQGVTLRDGGLLFGNHGWICVRPADQAARIALRRKEARENRLHQSIKGIGDTMPRAARAQGSMKIEVSDPTKGDLDHETASLANELKRAGTLKTE